MDTKSLKMLDQALQIEVMESLFDKESNLGLSQNHKGFERMESRVFKDEDLE